MHHHLDSHTTCTAVHEPIRDSTAQVLHSKCNRGQADVFAVLQARHCKTFTVLC